MNPSLAHNDKLLSSAASHRPAMTLEQERTLFKQNKFLAMPLAGTIVWALIGITSPFVSDYVITWIIYIGTGAIFYLGAGLSYLTGERFFAKNKIVTSFDRLFFVGLVMSLMVFGIALPVATIDHATVPLSIGILAGLMWMPLSWAIEHWVGYFHTIVRTVSIVGAWYLFPDARIQAISAVIVAVYLISITALITRFNSL